MEKFEDYRVPDLVRANTKWTFVLESPHRDEIRLGYPAAGDSGRVMSEVLLGATAPIGRLLQENDPLVASYSVMNASCIPLQQACYNEPHLCMEIAEIFNAIQHTGQGVVEAKKTIKRALGSQIGNRITKNLRLRLMRQLETNPHRIFIVCGLVAQSIFETSMNIEGRINWFHKSIVLNLEEKETTVFYENHPSIRSGGDGSKWTDKENIKHLLQLLDR